MGHFKNECPSWEKTANYVELVEDVLLMAQINLTKSEEEHVWYLDSGCSNHMCGTREWFIDFDDSFRQHVKLGDDKRMAVEGKGDLRLEINGIIQVISSVYFVPNLKNNLLSVGQLQQKGLRIIIEDDLCEIWHKKQRRLIMHSTMSANKMFVILATVKGPRGEMEANMMFMKENGEEEEKEQSGEEVDVHEGNSNNFDGEVEEDGVSEEEIIREDGDGYGPSNSNDEFGSLNGDGSGPSNISGVSSL